MSIRFPCPRCDVEITSADDQAGKPSECPRCGEWVRVPAEIIRKTRKPPPPIPQSLPVADAIAVATIPGTDTPGIISVVLGVFSVMLVLMGCFTYGLTCFGAAAFAIVGFVCGRFAKGTLRVAGLTLNGLVLILALGALFIVLWILGRSPA